MFRNRDEEQHEQRVATIKSRLRDDAARLAKSLPLPRSLAILQWLLKSGSRFMMINPETAAVLKTGRRLVSATIFVDVNFCCCFRR